MGNFDSVTTDGGSPQTRSANRQNEITAISGATTPTYDGNGNMTGDETGKQFVYDAWNRLVTVKNSGGTTLKTYAYDGLNRRASETASGTTTDLYYSAAWQVLTEKVGSNVTKRYVWSPVYVDAMVLRDRDTDANGSLDERLWVQQDANWNVTALLNGSGTVVERYAYDGFGLQGVYNVSWSAIGSSAYSWSSGFQGMFFDATASLSHQRERWYSPTLGRWVTIDPIRFHAGDVNLYRAIGNNPINKNDPSGLDGKFEVAGGFIEYIGTLTDKEKDHIKKLFSRMIKAIDAAIFELGDNQLDNRYLNCLLKWFSPDGTRPDAKTIRVINATVRRNLEKIREWLKAKGVKYEFINNPKISGVAFHGTDSFGRPKQPHIQINTAPPVKPDDENFNFWDKSEIEQLGTIFHELTHGFASTEDFGYMRPFGSPTYRHKDDLKIPITLTTEQLLQNASTYEGYLVNCLLKFEPKK